MSTPANNGKTLEGQTFDPVRDLLSPFVQTSKQEKNAEDELNVAKKDIDPIDGAASLVRTHTAAPADGDVLSGQTYNEEFDFVQRFTEQARTKANAATDLGTNRKDINPFRWDASIVRTYDISAIGAILAAKTNSFAGTSSFRLPDTLLAVVAEMNSNLANGFHSQEGSGISGGTSGSLSLNLASRSQGSASVIPTISATIEPAPDSSNVPSVHYIFFEQDNVTMAEVLARVSALAGASVLAWPKFREKRHTFRMFGQSVSVGVNVDVQQHRSFGPGNATGTNGKGQGDSNEFGISIQRDNIPPTIHGAITVTGTLSRTLEVSASAQATIISDGPLWPAANVGPRVNEKLVTGSVTPSSLASTGGATAIPITGLYLLSSNPQPFRYGYTLIHAVVVDFVFFAP